VSRPLPSVRQPSAYGTFLHIFRRRVPLGLLLTLAIGSVTEVLEKRYQVQSESATQPQVVPSLDLEAATAKLKAI
jgi:hypothetical protein